MQSLADAMDLSFGDIAVGNLYYDLFKAVLHQTFGTAFAVETPAGILHARNLGWWTRNGALARYTVATHFIGGPAGEFVTIGWPGFIGAFSGVLRHHLERGTKP